MEAFETAVRKMTVAEFRDLELDDDDRNLYELINGELVKRSAPATAHQRAARNLFAELLTHIRQHALGELFFAPYDVFLDEHNVPQPDLVFVDNASAYRITEIGIEGPPTLVVEIISPTSAIRDRNVKKNLYERHGVNEYWLVDAPNETVEIFTLENGRYELFSAASTAEGTLHSKTLAGLSLDVKALFHPMPPPPAPPAETA